MADETYTYDVWVTGSEPVASANGTVVSGQNLAKYAPLGQVTATGKFVIWNPAAVDGSQLAVRLAPYAIDATGGDVNTALIKSGSFNPDLVAWPTATAAEKLCAFMGTPISLQAPREFA